MAPIAGDLRNWLEATDVPYAGFSAGSAIAAARTVVGGWRHHGVPVCPEEEAGEDLVEIRVVDGLGLVEPLVDVHATQWGTVGRLEAAVRLLEPGRRGLAIDEDTALVVTGSTGAVHGRGQVHARGPGPATAQYRAGDVLTLG